VRKCRRFSTVHAALEGVVVERVFGDGCGGFFKAEEVAEIEQEVLARAALVAAGVRPFRDEGVDLRGGGLGHGVRMTGGSGEVNAVDHWRKFCKCSKH
jgi:hypothetical protein